MLQIVRRSNLRYKHFLDFFLPVILLAETTEWVRDEHRLALLQAPTSLRRVESLGGLIFPSLNIKEVLAISPCIWSVWGPLWTRVCSCVCVLQVGEPGSPGLFRLPFNAIDPLKQGLGTQGGRGEPMWKHYVSWDLMHCCEVWEQ